MTDSRLSSVETVSEISGSFDTDQVVLKQALSMVFYECDRLSL